MQSLLQIFHPAPPLPEMTDQEKLKTDYKYWRYRIFYSMLFGYAFYYFARRSFTFAMPGIIEDLGFDKSQLGILSSVLAISYGLSKFVSGIFADQSNPRYFMALGLFLTGLCNILFGLSSSLWVFMIVWGANGFFQGFGWPACARSLTNWYSHSERGAWWSSVNIAHNLGAFVTPWIVGFTLQYFGWRAGMYVPGIACFLGALFVINRMRDTPQSLGLPSIEKFRNDYPSKTSKEQDKGLSTRELLKDVLSNKYVWIIAVAYFFVYVLRMGTADWIGLFLYETKGYSALGSGGASSLFEIGGLCGALTAGWSSDLLFKARRGPVCTIFAVFILVSIFLFWMVPPGYVVLDWITIFMMGFSAFGPQMLAGLFASEMCHKSAAATANGFVGWVAYIGAAASGYPLGYIIDTAGWNGAFITLMGCAILCILCFLPLWNVSRASIQAKADAKSTS